MNLIIKERNSKKVTEEIILKTIEDLKNKGYKDITIKDISKHSGFSHSWVYKIVKGLKL